MQTADMVAISGSMEVWEYYADRYGIRDAAVKWHEFHNKGKYFICEAREDGDTRLFIRTVTDMLTDAFKKEGWWDVFTVTRKPVSKGIWLAKAIEYRTDRNGHLNLVAEPIMPMDDIQFHSLFSFKANGTWESVACWLIVSESHMFFDSYGFQHHGIFNPNLDALVAKFPELKNMSLQEMGEIMLGKFLEGETTLKEIEDCLNELTEFD